MLPFNGRFDLVLLCISTLFVSEVACVRVSVSGPFAATATIILILVFIILCCRFCCDCCRRDENKSQQQQQQQQRSLDIKQIRRQHQGANFGGEFHPVSQLEAQITFHQINRNETDRDMSNTTTSTNCGFALPATQDQTMVSIAKSQLN